MEAEEEAELEAAEKEAAKAAAEHKVTELEAIELAAELKELAEELNKEELDSTESLASISISDDQDVADETDEEVLAGIGKVTQEAINKVIENETRNFTMSAAIPQFTSFQTTNLRSDVYNIPERISAHLNPLVSTSAKWEQLLNDYNDAEDEKEKALTEVNRTRNSSWKLRLITEKAEYDVHEYMKSGNDK